MKISLIFGIIFFTIFSSFSQNNTINYKAIVKDNGNILVSQGIDIRFTIFVDGVQVYLETHNTTTDANGIAIVNIGAGTTSDTFSSINWSGGTTTLKTEIDSGFGSGFVNIGTTEFKSVPYALNVSGLTQVTENGNTGWRLETNPITDGGAVSNIGEKAIDMTIHDDGDWFLAGASGAFSFVANKDNYATGASSSAFGRSSFVSGSNSISAGIGGNISGSSSFGFGSALEVSANGATAIGEYNENNSNAVFMVGNGTFSSRSNALTVLKSGKTTVLESTPTFGEHAINGIKNHVGNSDNAGVYGENIVADYYGYGVYGKSGYQGVRGEVSGTGANNYYGVYGATFGTNTGANYGIYGTAAGAATNYAVYASGNLNYTGTLTNVSDRKFKNNIQPVNSALVAIQQLRPTTYDFKPEFIRKMNMPSVSQVGFIAQELQEVFPNLVSTNKHPGATKNDPSIEYLGINYVGLIPILTAGIKEQQTIIEQQQRTIDTQQQLLQDLLARVEALENR